MKEMKYELGNNNSEILYCTFDNMGYGMCIINIEHNHMCAYVTFPSIKYLNDYDNITVECSVHGGFTFLSTREDMGFDENIIWLGWDYAHLGDYNPSLPFYEGYKWTVEEVKAEAEEVLKCFKEGKFKIYN